MLKNFNLGIFYNKTKRNVFVVLDKIKLFANEKNLNIFLYDDWNELKTIENIDLALTLGGDGTLISVARFLLKKEMIVPIFGINLGHLGFLTEFDKDDFLNFLEKIIFLEEYNCHKREVLNIKIIGDREENLVGINDIFIKTIEQSRIIELDLFINKKFAINYVGDGLIVSSPLGSSAYSLAAGGPIVDPDMSAFIITAICPHKLNIRPLVISSNNEISINLSKKDNLLLSIDGQIFRKLDKDSKIIITKYIDYLHIIKNEKKTYFDILKEKFSLGK